MAKAHTSACPATVCTESERDARWRGEKGLHAARAPGGRGLTASPPRPKIFTSPVNKQRLTLFFHFCEIEQPDTNRPGRALRPAPAPRPAPHAASTRTPGGRGPGPSPSHLVRRNTARRGHRLVWGWMGPTHAKRNEPSLDPLGIYPPEPIMVSLSCFRVATSEFHRRRVAARPGNVMQYHSALTLNMMV